MPTSVPPSPEFGEPIERNGASPETLALMARRRSVSAATLIEPGPSREELKDLLRLAGRAPDHGKLAPWRFVVLSGEAKRRLVDALEPLSAGQPDPDKARAVLAKLRNPPVTVMVVSRLFESKIPEWEQQLSSGAVAMNLLIAAEAMGYAANWITDWYAYDAGRARDPGPGLQRAGRRLRPHRDRAGPAARARAAGGRDPDRLAGGLSLTPGRGRAARRCRAATGPRAAGRSARRRRSGCRRAGYQ